MAADELWELAVTVPPVTEETVKLVVRCGLTTIRVEPADCGRWDVMDGRAHDSVPTFERAVAVARREAERGERQRLLNNAVVRALDADVDGDSDG